MRPLPLILTSALLLASCAIPKPPAAPVGKPVNPPVAHPQPISFVELPMFQSSSMKSVTGTGAIAERLAERGMLEIGDENARGVLTVFTNYSCRYCQEFDRQMLGNLQDEFVRNGSLKIRMIIVPLFKYPNSALEAAALICGTVLGKGQDMNDALFSTALRTRPALLKIAAKLKLSAKSFTSCLDSKETKRLLAQQLELIHARNVTLIPTFTLARSNQDLSATGSGALGIEQQTGLPSLPDMRGWILEKAGNL